MPSLRWKFAPACGNPPVPALAVECVSWHCFSRALQHLALERLFDDVPRCLVWRNSGSIRTEFEPAEVEDRHRIRRVHGCHPLRANRILAHTISGSPGLGAGRYLSTVAVDKSVETKPRLHLTPLHTRDVGNCLTKWQLSGELRPPWGRSAHRSSFREPWVGPFSGSARHRWPRGTPCPSSCATQ